MSAEIDELRPEPVDITTLAEISSHWAGKTPDRLALTAGGQQWTYGEIQHELQGQEQQVN